MLLREQVMGGVMSVQFFPVGSLRSGRLSRLLGIVAPAIPAVGSLVR